ncbi:MAG TPA: abortive infection family protein [Candidatus Polarisedimenticolia bacterium]|nr:abortive infection family protein [Candidatus Polarisedimenticolia bacterium]
MTREQISRKTRSEFREYWVGTSLRLIEIAFDEADIECDLNYHPTVGGERRKLVEQYYHSLDWTNWNDVKKFLVVYESVLEELEEQAGRELYNDNKYATRAFSSLRKWIERDGFAYKERRLTRSGKAAHIPEVQAAASELDVPELHRQIDRMRGAVESDPRLAIGTAKELVETTCKTILRDFGIEADSGWDIARLVKETRTVLKLLPEDVPEASKGADTIRRILSNLGAVAQGLAELRNLYGTGHGPDGRARGLHSRHARLAAGAASTLAAFLLETFEERSSQAP